MKKVLGFFIFFVCVAICNPSAGFTYSLAGDWSNTINPIGPWSYNAGNIPLPFNVANWPTGEFGQEQTAWAYSNDNGSFLPGWFKSVANPNPNSYGIFYDWLMGDVIVHSTSWDNGGEHGVANVTWTSPFAGMYDVYGGLWAGRDIGRGNNWSLYLNNAWLAGGSVSSGDGFSRANPDSFDLQGINISQGDVFKLEVIQPESWGGSDFVGVNFNINPVPEPATMLLFGLGGVGLAIRRRFQKSV